jgi:uncharacterized membrane protein
MEYICLLLFGVLLIIAGIQNFKGNIFTIHWYNRRKVSKAEFSKYGKAMGIGTCTIGVSVVLTAILQMIFDLESIFYLTAVGVAIGLAILLFAQFKYNKGIF